MEQVEAQVGAWELRVRTHAGGGLYELEESTTWTVVEAASGRVLRSYKGLYEASYDGAGWSDGSASGVTGVELHADRVVVTWADGRVEEEPLP